MELKQINDEIENKIKESEAYQKRLVEFMTNYEPYDAKYDKEVGINILSIKNGKTTEWEGQELKGILGNANLIEKTAKAMAWETRMNADVQEKQYRIIMKLLDSIADNKTGYQSINKHLSSI